MFDFTIVMGSFLISTLLMGRVIAFCKKQQLVDTVNERSSHKAPTPRGGGIIIVLMTLMMGIAHAGYSYHTTHIIPAPYFMAFLVGAALVAFIGFLDDKKSRPAWLRFGVHILATSMVVYFVPQLIPHIPLWLDKALLVLAWVWFINLFNFMDGIDGIAGAEAVFLAAALSFLSPFFKPLLLVLAGSSLGFLRSNIANPSKVFMGDVGSTFLGYILGGIFIMIATWSNVFALFVLPLVFTADATYTLIARLFRGEKPWHAHKEHFYQRAVHRVGLTHRQVVMRVTVINILLLFICLFGLFLKWGAFTLLPAVVLMLFVAWRIRYMEGK